MVAFRDHSILVRALGIIVAAVVAGAAWVFSASPVSTAGEASNSPRAARELGLWPAPPMTISDLVDSSDVIVVGRVAAVVDEYEMGPYEDNSIQPDSGDDEALDPAATPTPALPGVPVTLYEVAIERVLLGDGKVEEGRTLLYLDAGSAAEKMAFMDSKPMPQTGDDFLFALDLNPDGANYSAGRWGLIDISGESVTYADWERTPVSYADQLTADEFVDALGDEAQRKERDVR